MARKKRKKPAPPFETLIDAALLVSRLDRR
jgi:hypothetical protein